MKQLFLTNEEASLFYTLMGMSVYYLKNEIKNDIRYEAPKEVLKQDKELLELAKKLRDFAITLIDSVIISEVENPF